VHDRSLPTRRGAARPRPGAARRAALAGLTSVALLAAGVAPVALAPAALADPAPAAPTSTFGAGVVAGTVPDGVCAVQATVVGGAGGRSAAGANGRGANGGAASIVATFPVVPGTSVGGSVGGGGGQNSGTAGGAGGAGGGGVGGAVAGQHGGAGGGGYSELLLGGDLVVLAGGGGGSGGGHSVSTDGFGGDAGLPTAPGQVAAGSPGTDGYEGQTAALELIVVGGGQGGTETAGGGGTHSTDATLDGLAGSGRTGGAGAFDPTYDAGGGGGGGYAGGGGGASTVIQNSENDGSGARIETVAGGGGGGGSSFVAASASDVSATAVGRVTGTGAGPAGSVTLDWVECAYDLAVTKTVSVEGGAAGATGTATSGDVLTWTVTVTNTGPQAMTRGDVVTLRDTLPGAGAATITSVSTSGGTSGAFERGPLTCDAAAGDAVPAALVCTRPFALLGETPSGSRGLDVGETLTIVSTQTVADAPGAVLANTASVEDRGNPADNAATATVTVIGPPTAVDDADTGNTIGDAVAVDVLANDSGVSAALDPASVVLRDPSGGWVTSLAVAGEGTWSVDPATGTVTFRPEAGFLVDPTPIGYRVTDANGLSATATVTVDYVPAAADDADLGHAIGDVVVVDALGNDTGDLVPGSTRLVTSAGDRVTELVVPGEGTWTVDARIGAVTFAPEEGFVVDPSPVTYEVTDSTGDTVAAVITVGYVPDAADDASRGNVVGDTVPVDVLANDAGDMDPASVRLLGPDGAPVTELAVPGEGTWAVDARTGVVTFTPEAGFERNPAPVSYQVTDSTGDTVAAQVLVTYRPVATDDVRTGRAPGQPVTVEVVGNDTGDLDPASVRLVGPSGDRVTLLRVAGEGVWTVDPETGHITFTPQDGYDGNPTPVTYEVASTAGDVAVARVVVTYLPQAADDADEGNVRGTAVTVDVVGNDRGSLDPTSVRLVGPGGDLVTTLTVAGQGVWSVDPRTGAITFTPEAGFTGDPDPVRYRVLDVEGNPTTAQVRITYRAADPAPAGLAVTGAGAAGAAGGAALLLLLGAALVAWRRRGARA
jgi:uncharacterized repeat protein (TIGR01451 family)